MEIHAAEVFQHIREKGDLPDEMIELLKKTIEEFKLVFAPSTKAAV